jgi:hypothetical protein
MQDIVDLILKVWTTLSQAGLSPLDIALAIVCAALYVKTNKLDDELHKCLEHDDDPVVHVKPLDRTEPH